MGTDTIILRIREFTDGPVFFPLMAIAFIVAVYFLFAEIERQENDERKATRAYYERELERVHGAYLAKIEELLVEIRMLRSKE